MSRATSSGTSLLPEVNFSEDAHVRYLHLGSEWVQGTMWLERPFDLQLEYVQRMMAGLLFLPAESWAGRHAMQLGLGAGALTKFCHRKLRWRATAIEINPAVWRACRNWFRLPADDSRLQVVIADAARAIREARWLQQVDLLQVDLYDHDAACPVLDGEAFYRDCRALLTEDGQLTVNLFGRQASFERSLAGLAAAFGREAVWSFRPTREGNQVVLAQRRAERPPRDELLRRAAQVEARCGLPARKWIRGLSPAFD